MKGIDIYHGNGSVDWPKVAAAGYSFAILKATQGTTFNDPAFKKNVTGARKAGLKVGAYHFANFSSPASAQAEAKHFAAIVKGIKLDLALALDLEVNHAGKQLVASMQAFFDELKKLDGRKAALYSFGYFYLDNLKGHHAGIPLWYARYASSPIGVSSYAAWQHSSTTKVPGISGNVDEDIAGDRWNDLLIASAAKAPSSAKKTPVKPAPVSVKTTSYYVTAGALNIRKTPGGKILGVLKHGDRVQVISISGGWAKLKSGSKQVYVSSKYISKTKNPASAAPKKTNPVTHKVVSGDTVSELAKHYGVSIAQIKKLNNLNSKYVIYIGQTLKIK